MTDENISRFSDYMNYFNDAQKKYGNQSTVLYQCGMFYELYGVDNETEKLGNVEEISTVLNIQMTRTKKEIKDSSRSNPQMAGVNVSSIEKYLDILMVNGYTVVLVVQNPQQQNRSITRSIKGVYSPGTYINSTKLDNNLVCMYFSNNIICQDVNICSLDICTGNIIIYYLNNYTKENIYRLLQILQPQELLICDMPDTFDIKAYDLSKATIIHYLKVNKDFTFIKFQNEFLREYYNTSFLDPIEFLNLELYPASVSCCLCLIINFCSSYNKDLLINLGAPKIYTETTALVLENNAVNQINLPELFVLINKKKTPMGERLLKSRLYNPIYDEKEINERYDYIDKFSDYNIYNAHFTKHTGLVGCDFDKIIRKIELGKINIIELYKLYRAIKYFYTSIDSSNTEALEILNYFAEVINIDLFNSETNIFETNIFNSIELREVFIEIDKTKKTINEIANMLSFIVSTNTNAKMRTEIVHVEYNNDIGYHFVITPLRYNILSKNFKQFIVDDLIIKLNEFDINQKKASNYKLSNGVLNTLNEHIEHSKNKIDD